MSAINTLKILLNNEDSLIKIIKHPRKSMFFDGDSTWINKGDSALFDVIMDYYEGAEVFELGGLYLLHKPSFIVDNDANNAKLDRLCKDSIALYKGKVSLSISRQT